MQTDLFTGKVSSPGRSFLTSEKEHIVCSISGGRSSGVMAYILETEDKYRDYQKHYVFMNTGRELPKTISFLKNIQDNIIKRPIHLIEAKVYHEERKSSGYNIMTWDTLSMDGEPFEDMIKKYGTPSVEAPHCTRELKINPIKSFITEYLGIDKDNYRQAIGIRIDEARRTNKNPEFIYPLCDFYINKPAVNRFWNKPENKPYDLGSDCEDGFEDYEGNCDFCFKKSWSKLLQMREKYPDRLQWWKQIENVYDSLDEYPIYRDHKTAKDLEDRVEHTNDHLECLCGANEDLFFKAPYEIKDSYDAMSVLDLKI